MLFPAAMQGSLMLQHCSFQFSIGRLPLCLLSPVCPLVLLLGCSSRSPAFPLDSFVNSSRFSPPPLNGRPSRLPLWMPPVFLVYLQCVCVTESPAHCGRRDAVALQRDERSVMRSDRQHSCSPGSLTSGTAANSMHIK